MVGVADTVAVAADIGPLLPALTFFNPNDWCKICHQISVERCKWFSLTLGATLGAGHLSGVVLSNVAIAMNRKGFTEEGLVLYAFTSVYFAIAYFNIILLVVQATCSIGLGI